jgi:hypothetical protein
MLKNTVIGFCSTQASINNTRGGFEGTVKNGGHIFEKRSITGPV